MLSRSASRRSFLVVAVAIGMSGQSLAQLRFERISVSSAEVEANNYNYSSVVLVSADGRFVFFDSYATNLAQYDLNGFPDVFVRDRQLGTTALLSTALTGLAGNNTSSMGGISGDGRFVVISSHAGDLVKFDTNRVSDTFLTDRDPDGNGIFDEGNATMIRVSVDSSGLESDSYSYFGDVSDDGTRVVFASEATNLVAGDTNGYTDVFLRDLTTGVTERVSISSSGVQTNSYSQEPKISSDGNVVCFVSYASNLVGNDTNGAQDIFVRDLVAGTTTRVSVRTNGTQANDTCNDPSMSRDGNLIVFSSRADNLVAGDGNGLTDVFLHDRSTARTTRITVSESGAEADGESYAPRLSMNGNFATFSSPATNLAGIETNHSTDVFVVDLATHQVRKATTYESGEEGGGFGYSASDDGLIVALTTGEFEMVGGDANGVQDVFVRDFSITDPEASWTNYGAGWPGTLGIPSLTSTDPVLGSTVHVQIGNSLGFYAVGFLLLGFDDASIQTNLGGTILVDSLILQAILLDPSSTQLSGLLPLDDNLVGVSLFLQVLEMDAGASNGVSFTPGLELLFGQ